MFKVTVSGDYRTNGGSQGDVIDFNEVVGYMPECAEEMVMSHIQNRLLGDWIRADKRYTARFSARRTVFIDKIEVVPGVPSCNGKDIKKMSWGELQDLAISKNLLRIPLKNAVSEREAREIAYLEYSDKVLDEKINTKDEFNFSKLPALIVEGELEAAAPERKISNEEAIAEEEEVSSDISFSDLKKEAKRRDIKFSNKTSKKELIELLSVKVA
jgi:hypothetical protein